MIPLFIQFRWLDLVDIFLVAILLYQLYRLVKGTPALNIFVGIAVFYVIYRIIRLSELELFSSIMAKFIDVGIIVLVVVFQQELRRFFLFLGTSNLLGRDKLKKAFTSWGEEEQVQELDFGAIIKACRNMSESRTGAIIVITRGNDLKFYANTGDPVEAKVSVRMIESIFYKNSPLHDGAIIITDNVIRAARCVLPVTENNDFPAHLGMRHRAAVGVTENSDAVAVVVSEQTGELSVAYEGKLHNRLSPERMKEMLVKLMEK
ncbi:MAG: hypothetical protein FD123_3943 [Bacteroidetes bacterium]|nr:MAG: hypothetical protein FD123_3943 [Bacteroidota bacterium]